MVIFSDITAANSVINSTIKPVVNILCLIASLVCTAFIICSGIHYILSSGNPEKLDRAKKIIKNSLIGLIIVLSATAFTSLLNHSYHKTDIHNNKNVPIINSIKPDNTSLGLVGVLIKAITGVLQDIIVTIGRPFVNALSYFTNATPLMADNASVFNLWLIIVAIADVLFAFVICLVGFNIMSASTLGFDELDVKQLIPQAILIFLLINSSIFLIDSIITISNGLIAALKAGVGESNVWLVLENVTKNSSALGLATLLIMVVFLVFTFILLIYYIGRIVTLYLGAVLSQILILLWLLPSFKDFATSAARTYISTIFVLFIHVVILSLASSILSSLNSDKLSSENSLLILLIGMSTLIILLKTQGVLSQLNYASIGPKSIRRLSKQFINSFSVKSVNYES
ncbi:MAG TPA: pilin [Patescibacteria group bacterium]|nr:pilin [Patescibacteria group bacterium]